MGRTRAQHHTNACERNREIELSHDGSLSFVGLSSRIFLVMQKARQYSAFSVNQ
jgi:hypothetical protein